MERLSLIHLWETRNGSTLTSRLISIRVACSIGAHRDYFACTTLNWFNIIYATVLFVAREILISSFWRPELISYNTRRAVEYLIWIIWLSPVVGLYFRVDGLSPCRLEFNTVPSSAPCNLIQSLFNVRDVNADVSVALRKKVTAARLKV